MRGQNKFFCSAFHGSLEQLAQMIHESIVVTYEIRVFFEGAQKEIFSSIF
jgi:hypothetical protein